MTIVNVVDNKLKVKKCKGKANTHNVKKLLSTYSLSDINAKIDLIIDEGANSCSNKITTEMLTIDNKGDKYKFIEN